MQMSNGVSEFKPGQSKCHTHEIHATSTSEDQTMPARFQHPQALTPDFRTGNPCIPTLAHKSTLVRFVRIPSNPCPKTLDSILCRMVG